MTAIRLAIVGLGKIARDQHVPALSASDRFALVATASHAGCVEGLPAYGSLAELLASDIDIDAIAMCQPPQARFADAQAALRAGKHVLLEKPPGVSPSEVIELDSIAAAKNRTLFAAWHSRFGPAVQDAAAWLARRRIARVRIVWKEDVRRWHPGQRWIWEAGGFGVFDPGINALSIATAILPEPLTVRGGWLETPANCEAPIAAEIDLVTESGAPIHAAFDFRQTGTQTWTIDVATDAGVLSLRQGGAQLVIGGLTQPASPEAEYPALYARFADLINSGEREVDVAPLQLVADAYQRCRRRSVEAFVE